MRHRPTLLTTALLSALLALPLHAQEAATAPLEDPDAAESAASDIPLEEIRRLVG